MVGNVTSLTNNGLRDWVIQRVSAVIIASYTIFILVYFSLNPDLNFSQWQNLYESLGMRVYSFLVLLSLGLHAWVGIWTVTTDYLKGLGLRFIVQTSVALVLLGTFVWGIEILWGM